MALFSRKKTTPTPTSDAPFTGDSGEAPAPEQRPAYPARKGGRPTVQNPRTRRVSMSLTDEEHAAWTAAAGGGGLSAWAREQVTAQLEQGQPQVHSAEVAKLRADLGRVGSNLNQLMRAVNSGQAPGSQELLQAVQATREELARVRVELP